MHDEPEADVPLELTVNEQQAGKRLDVFLADEFPSYSRVQFRRAIGEAGVLVDGRKSKGALRLRVGQRITVQLPQQPVAGPQPEAIDIEVLYEDEHLVAINKPPLMVVHPGRGHWSGTLTNALAYHFMHLSAVGGPHRPGIVHRLDRDTSGVIVVAKTDSAHFALAAQFEARTTDKEYFAIVAGVPDRDRDRIEQPIGIHPYQREKMAIRAQHATSREAMTFFEVEKRYRGFATLRLSPKTGRTHQLRVHLAHLRTPVLCDRLYGGRAAITRGEICGSDDAEVVLERQALHARRLTIQHPVGGRTLEFEAPLPDDLRRVIDLLKEFRRV